MERKHIITLSGKPGSGKSSTSDRVAEMLGYTRYSSGSIVRSILEEQNLTMQEYNEQAKNDHALDTKVDEALRDLRDKRDVVVDSRLGFYWIPESFKVYLDLDIDVATARIFNDKQSNRERANESHTTLAEASSMVRARMQAERSRFRQMYRIDPFDASHFDLVIDTSRHSPETVAITVFDNYQKWLNSDTWKPIHSSIPIGYSFKNKY